MEYLLKLTKLDSNAYQEIFKNLPFGVIVTDVNGTILEVNSKAQDCFHQSLSCKDTNIFKDNLFGKFNIIDAFTECLRGKQFSLEISVSFSSLKVTFTPNIINDKTNTVLLVLDDITHYNKIKSNLYSKNQILQHVIDNIPYYVWMKNVEGQYLLVNQKCEELCQLSSRSIVGKTDSELFGVISPGLAKSAVVFDKISLDGPICYDEQIEINKDGPRWFRKVKTPVFDKCGEVIGTVGIAIDQTDEVKRKELIKQYINQINEVMESNRFIK